MVPDGASSIGLRDIAGIFLRLGITGFGGPVAHIAMMRREFVDRRRWISSERFVDMLGAVNLLPGPNSTELAISIGAELGGRPGTVVAGIAFITPAALIVMVAAWLYERFGALPDARALLGGVAPVVLALILHAAWELARGMRRRAAMLVLAPVVVAGSFIGVHELVLLLACGLLLPAFGLIRGRTSRSAKPAPKSDRVERTRRGWQIGLGLLGGTAAPTIGGIFLYFLFLGSMLYGSGYVLVEFLRRDLVGPGSLGWITNQQLVDAVAVGQITPGPLFTTATFIGYLVGGVSGGIAATVGIFLPSFIFVLLTHRWIARMRSSVHAGAFLDGVNIGALGLIISAIITLGEASLTMPWQWAVGMVALGAALWGRVHPIWLILGGAVVGTAISFLNG